MLEIEPMLQKLYAMNGNELTSLVCEALDESGIPYTVGEGRIEVCEMSNVKMPLNEIRRILENGEWWDNMRDTSPDEPRPWLDELNGAIEAALGELQAYHDAEASGKFLQKGDIVYWPKLQSEGADFTRVDTILITDVCKFHGAISFGGVRLHERWTEVEMPFEKAIVGHCGFCDGDIGTYVWLTREEAEEALKAMEAKAE